VIGAQQPREFDMPDPVFASEGGDAGEVGPTLEQAKQLARSQVETMRMTQGRLMEEHSASLRWFMASLLALNGAGLASIAQQADLAVWYKISASAAFYLGVMGALAIGWFGQRSAQAALSAMSQVIAFWIIASVKGEIDEAAHKEVHAQADPANKLVHKSPRFAGWLSAVGFTIGVVMVGVGIGMAPIKLAPATTLAPEKK